MWYKITNVRNQGAFMWNKVAIIRNKSSLRDIKSKLWEMKVTTARCSLGSTVLFLQRKLKRIIWDIGDT